MPLVVRNNINNLLLKEDEIGKSYMAIKTINYN